MPNDIENSPIYFDHMLVAEECAEGMMTRLELMQLEPSSICVNGWSRNKLALSLQEKYANNTVILADETKQQVDMILANLYLPWQQQANHIFKNWQNKLKKKGLIMLTALGPDTCKECPIALKEALLPRCIDMHDIGDALIHTGFADPVLDVTYLTLNYNTNSQLITELKTWHILDMACEIENENWTEVTFEIIHAHAWQADTHRAEAGEVKIPVASLYPKN